MFAVPRKLGVEWRAYYTKLPTVTYSTVSGLVRDYVDSDARLVEQ